MLHTRSGKDTKKCANMRFLPTAIAILSVVLAMLLLVLLAQRVDHVPFAVNDSLDDSLGDAPPTDVEQASIAVGAVLLLFCAAAYILSPREARRERMRKAEKLSDDLFPVDPDPNADIVDPDPEL